MNYERLAERLVERPYNRGTVRRAAEVLKKEIDPLLRAINEASDQGVRWPKDMSRIVDMAAKVTAD